MKIDVTKFSNDGTQEQNFNVFNIENKGESENARAFISL